MNNPLDNIKLEEVVSKEQMRSFFLDAISQVIDNWYNIVGDKVTYSEALEVFDIEIAGIMMGKYSGSGYREGSLLALASACVCLFAEGMMLAKEQNTTSPSLPERKASVNDG